ncbi:hypothetical protein PT2222_40056 [Paraburkholderia tropica]
MRGAEGCGDHPRARRGADSRRAQGVGRHARRRTRVSTLAVARREKQQQKTTAQHEKRGAKAPQNRTKERFEVWDVVISEPMGFAARLASRRSRPISCCGWVTPRARCWPVPRRRRGRVRPC